MDVVLQFLEARRTSTARPASLRVWTAEPPSADRICSARLVKEKLSTSPLSASPISRWMRPSVDEVNCSGTSRMLFSPASARARMRWYSRVVFPLPEPPKSSFNMMNLSVGSVFYRGRLALIFLSLYHKIAATSILWYNEEKSSQKEDTCMKILAVDYGDSAPASPPATAPSS